MLGSEQDQRIAHQDRGAIAELIGRGQKSDLIGVVGGLVAPGIDDDVLG